MIFEDYWNISDATADKINRAHRVVQKRYPRFPTSSLNFRQPNVEQFAERHWANSMDGPVLESGELTEHVVKNYLELISREKKVKILPVQDFNSPQVGWEDNPDSFIPFRVEDSWAFAKTYKNCVHWFDNLERSCQNLFPSSSKKIAENWTGPKCQDSSSSGIYMLIGIRRLIEGLPHLSVISSADTYHFRCYMLAELMIEKLNPDGEDIESLNNQNGDHSFFDDAMFGMQRPRSPMNLRYTIAHHLNAAVKFCRWTRLTEKTSLATLWHLVSSKVSLSEFHSRYFHILFHNRIKEFNDIDILSQLRCEIDPNRDSWIEFDINHPELISIRKKKAEGQKLADFCEKGKDWGLGKYALLCAIPRGCTEDFFAALNDGVMMDDVRGQLEQAIPLVEWILTCIHSGEFPSERLMIENYREDELMTSAYYAALTSLNPRVKIPIPRQISIGLSEDTGATT